MLHPRTPAAARLFVVLRHRLYTLGLLPRGENEICYRCLGISQFIARLLDGEKMAGLCRGVRHLPEAGYKIYRLAADEGLVGDSSGRSNVIRETLR